MRVLDHMVNHLPNITIELSKYLLSLATTFNQLLKSRTNVYDPCTETYLLTRNFIYFTGQDLEPVEYSLTLPEIISHVLRHHSLYSFELLILFGVG